VKWSRKSFEDAGTSREMHDSEDARKRGVRYEMRKSFRELRNEAEGPRPGW
jgi:hypothetical protein